MSEATGKCPTGAAKSKGAALYWRQLYALFLKRAISAKRDSLAAILQILVPIFLVLLALEAGNASITRAQQPTLDISRCTIASAD